MRSWLVAVIAGCLFAAPFAAQAYSIYPDASSSAGAVVPASNAGTTTNFDWGGAWNELSSPFQKFVSTLKTINPDAIPTIQVNPSTQIQSMIPQNLNAKDVFVGVLNFLTLIFGWLIGLSDKFAAWVISLIH